MPPWVAPLIGGIAGALGGAGSSGQKQTTRTNQRQEPWYPIRPGLIDAGNEAYNLFRRQMGGAYDQPPPTRDLSSLYGYLGYGEQAAPGSKKAKRQARRAARQERRAERRAGQESGGAPQMAPAPGGGGPMPAAGGGGGGGGGTTGYAGSNVAQSRALLEQAALEGNPAIDAANAYAQRSLEGFDPTTYLNQFMSGEWEDSPLMQRTRDMIGRRYGEAMQRHLADYGDTFEMTGMGGGSAHALGQAAEKGQFAEAMGDAVTQAELGLRGQNMDLLKSAMGWQADVMGQVPALEQARLAGPKALSDHDLNQAAIQAQIQAAQIQASAQRYAAQQSADAQRYAASLSLQASKYATDAQNYRAEMQDRQWKFGALSGLEQTGYEDQLRQWQYGQSVPGNYIDDYLRRALPIAGAGHQLTGTNVTEAHSNPWVSGLLGGLGGAAMGAGMYGQLRQG